MGYRLSGKPQPNKTGATIYFDERSESNDDPTPPLPDDGIIIPLPEEPERNNDYPIMPMAAITNIIDPSYRIVGFDVHGSGSDTTYTVKGGTWTYERGIPAEEIKFIHEANTEAKKLELFKKTRKGEVSQEEELKAKTSRLNELNALLNVDKRENEIVDGEPDEGDDEPKKGKSLER